MYLLSTITFAYFDISQYKNDCMASAGKMRAFALEKLNPVRNAFLWKYSLAVNSAIHTGF